MKYFFGADITADENNSDFDGGRFVVAKADEELTNKADQLQDRIEELEKQRTLPELLKLSGFVAGLVVLVALFGIVRGLLQGKWLSNMLNSAPATFIVMVLCAGYWIGLKVYSRKKARDPQRNKQIEDAYKALERTWKKGYEKLNVPYKAPMIDILCFRYKCIDGEQRISKMSGGVDFIPFEAKVYVKDGKFYISSTEELYEIPLGHKPVTRLVRDKRIMDSWNKEVSYKKEPYRFYKVSANGNGYYVIHSYYTLDFSIEEETYQLMVPSYDMDVLSELLGLGVNTIDDLS